MADAVTIPLGPGKGWRPMSVPEAPTTGTWSAGDYLLNTVPSNGLLGWYCTVGGTPGTWVPDVVAAQLTALPGLALTDLNGTDVNNWSTTWPAQRWELRRGSEKAPTNGHGPGFKISQVEDVTDLAAQMGGSQGQNQANAALHVAARGLDGSLGQTNAILATASGNPAPGTDVCALASWTRVRGETGTAFGAYLEGRRDMATAHAIGAEIGVRDFSGVDGDLGVNGNSDTMGIWVSTVSDVPGVKSAAGVVLGAGNGCSWKVGYTVAEGAVFNHTFRDESGSEISFMSRGQHHIGLDMSDATFTGYAIRLPKGTTNVSGIEFGQDVALFRTGPGRLAVNARIESADPGWHTVTLLNSWQILDQLRAPVYRLMADGTVKLRGMMKHGLSGYASPAFVVGPRPACDESFAVASNNGTARIVVKTTGEVIVWSYGPGGSNAFVSLSGVRYSID